MCFCFHIFDLFSNILVWLSDLGVTLCLFDPWWLCHWIWTNITWPRATIFPNASLITLKIYDTIMIQIFLIRNWNIHSSLNNGVSSCNFSTALRILLWKNRSATSKFKMPKRNRVDGIQYSTSGLFKQNLLNLSGMWWSHLWVLLSIPGNVTSPQELLIRIARTFISVSFISFMLINRFTKSCQSILW